MNNAKPLTNISLKTANELQEHTTKVFVYGTLKPGYGNYSRYCDGRVSGAVPATFDHGTLYHVSSFPAMVKGVRRVYGFVLELCSPEILDWLDGLEGYRKDNPADSMYRRHRAIVRDSTGASIRCWTYIWNCPTDGLALVPSGNWDPRGLHEGYFKDWPI